MEDIHNEIFSLLKKSRMPKMIFYTEIGMSGEGFNLMIKKKSMKITTLKKIAAVLDVPIEYFFSFTEEMKQRVDAIVIEKGLREKTVKTLKELLSELES